MSIYKRVIRGSLILFLSAGGILFSFAGTLNYWQAWLALLCFQLPNNAMTIYWFKHKPSVLINRIKINVFGENRKIQKPILYLIDAGNLLTIMVCGLDHRFQWTEFSHYQGLLGDILILTGRAIIFLSIETNPYASSIIEVTPGQPVISSGIYGQLRHPLYLGNIVMSLGIPIALSSEWGILTILLVIAGFIWRLLDEEKFLKQHLAGYDDYMHKVKSRLVPCVW